VSELDDNKKHREAATPNTWATPRLSELCSIIYGYTDSATLEPIGPRFLRITDIQDDMVNWDTVPYCNIEPNKLSRYRLQSGDIVFSRTGATTGKSFLVSDPPEAVFASYLIRLRLSKDLALPKFVNYFFQTSSYWQVIAKGSVGSAQGGFNATKLGELVIPMPPIKVQERIVALLDEALESVATAKANTLKSITCAREACNIYSNELLVVRSGWKVSTIGESCILRSGTTLPPTMEKATGEIPYLKVADMNLAENLDGVTGSSRYVGRTSLSASNILPTGTTIFPKRGGAILTNKKRLTTCPICADLNIMGVYPTPRLDPRFLFHYFLGLDLRQFNSGSSIPQINNYNIEPLIIAFPTSVAEQKRISAMIDRMAEETEFLVTVLKKRVAALDDLRKSLLCQAFSGNL
jgi:type I restriction enzyme S subunit